MKKEDIRKEYMEKREKYSEEERLTLSQKALNNLIVEKSYQDAENIFCFVSMGSEINTHIAIEKFFEDGKNVFVPLTRKGSKIMKFSVLKSLDDLEEGNFGVLEPKEEYIDFVDPNIADLVVVPGLAFDKNGYRIGYGGGFYDRFFSSLDKDPVKLGYCFSFQIYEGDLPIDEYDIAVDKLITD